MHFGGSLLTFTFFVCRDGLVEGAVMSPVTPDADRLYVQQLCVASSCITLIISNRLHIPYETLR